ncbi:PolC-type DNA polymerase III [candidate division FCPU426 bacterium]|nr:PolC-type DNA polymerase III [candidate division FCPU426 bacterium]
MSPEIILEPKGISPRLRELIEKLELAPDTKKDFLAAVPRSVHLSCRPAALIVRLDSDKRLPRELLEKLRTLLEVQLTESGKVQMLWDVHYSAGVMSALEYVQEHWTDLLGVFSRTVHMAGAYLSLVRFTNSGGENRVRIALANEMSLVALQRQDADKIMGRLLSERLNMPVQVRFEIGEFTQEVREREALYRKRIREELERIQQENEEPGGIHAPQTEASKQPRWRVVYGRKISAVPTPIAAIKEEETNVVVEGELIAFECKTLRTGRQLVLMDIYDKTSTINARLFVDAGRQLSPEVKKSAYARLRGSIQYDKYTQDLCLFLKDISLGEKSSRRDMAPQKRIELHAHTQMSAMDAMVSVSDLIKQAAAFGHEAIAITDHGVVQAYPEAMAAAKKHGCKVLYGMEGYLIEDAWAKEQVGKKPPRPYHISILIAKPQGIRNLYHLVSEAHLNHFYRHPRILRSSLNHHREGLLLGSACEQGEVIQHILRGADDETLAEIVRRYDYLEIMPRENNHFLIREGQCRDEEALLDINRRILAIGRKNRIPVVATGDVHFLEPGDEIYRSILQAGMGYEDAAQQAPLFFKTTQEMLEEFAYLGEKEAYEVVVEAPRRIAAQIGDIEPLKQKFYPPKLPEAERELERRALERARMMYGDPLPELVAQRLAREIKGINENHFASLFLIARRLVHKSIDDGYLVGSRGSVGSSLTATMLGITEVNPLPGHYLCPQCRCFELAENGCIGADIADKACPRCQTMMEKIGFDIPFEVFMGFNGNKLPDIDLNFSGEYQAKAHKALEEIFDAGHIFRAGTISTVADRIAYGFVKKYLEENKLVVREAEVNRLTRGCAGVKKTTGQHPGGIMIVPADMEIHDFTPVQRPADDRDSEITTTHLDYHAIHDSLLKLDILGHDDPTSLRRLGDMTGVNVRSIPLDDPDTLKIFSGLETLRVQGDIGTAIGTLGIPEFGTEFVRQMLEATRPTVFSELVRISGLSHGTDVWLNNAAELIKDKTVTLSTVISARDDIMNYLNSKGMDPEQAFQIMESVRKGKGLNPEQEAAMREHNVPAWYIASCKKIKYIFPKAHAVAYCIMAFRIAYFKVHFPAAFYTNYFSLNAEFFNAELVVRGGPRRVQERIQELKNRQDLTAKDKNSLTVLEVVREAFARGITFLPVSLSDSHQELFTLVGEKELLPPLISLTGLGLTCALRISEERVARPFRSVEELAQRTGANKNVIEIMTLHRCLDILPKADQTSLFG